MGLILVIDDEQSVRDFIKLILEGNHFIIEAATGEDALRIAKKVRPTLIILDMRLNGEGQLSGLDVCLAITKQAPLAGIPILVISGRAERDEISNFSLAGATMFLDKPFSMNELELTVARLIELEVVSIARMLAAAGESDLVAGVKNALVMGNTIKIIRALKTAIQEIEAELDDKS